VNSEINELKQAIVRVRLTILRFLRLVLNHPQSIKAGQAVFFGCDVGQFSNSGKDVGIMDVDYFEYEVGYFMHENNSY
jgi:bleomycin hydrolase